MLSRRRKVRRAPSVARVALGSLVVLAVLLIGGALPALSSPPAPGRQMVPLRVQNLGAYRQGKATAERRYESWRQRHGLSPLRSPTAPLTVVSGSLNKPGLTNGSDPNNAGTPSDSTGAIGPSNYVEFVNSEIAIYSKTDLTAPTSHLDEASFVGDPSEFTCDPQVQWDQQGQRWLYAALDCGAAPGSEQLYFGWSKTASPGPLNSNWCQYQVPTGASLEDYPKLGHDNTQIIVGTNAYDDSTDLSYKESHIWVFAKPGNGVTTCPTPAAEGVTTATPFVVGDTTGGAFTPVPANVADSSATGYVVAMDQDQAHLDLYAVGNGAPTKTTVTVPAFDLPATVPQPGTTDEIDSLDGRLTQAVAVTDPATGHEGIWTQHTVAGSSGGPSVVRWYELTPGASTPRQIGTVGGPGGSFAFNGAISPTKDGTSAAIFYNSGSSTHLVDMRVQDRRADTPLGTSVEDLQLATSPFEDSDLSCPSQSGVTFPCRWGDYAGASPDPSNACLVWGTGMLTVDPPDVAHPFQWGTQNAAIDVCGFILSVAKTGTGSGSVSSNIGGISCGAVCSRSFGKGGTSVTLTATAGTGSSFTGWSGACSGTGTCTVSMTQARAVTATFTLLPETLTVTESGTGSGTVSSNPAGISCGSTCAHVYGYGTSVTLTATPASTSRFTGWSGACSGSGSCIVPMTAAEAVQATFTEKPACIVPKVKGKKLAAAKSALTKALCKPGKISRKFSKVKKGRVISQKPKSGTRLAVGAKVNLAVSKGKKP